MILTIKNNTGSSLSYLSDAVIIPALTTSTISNLYHLQLSSDGELRRDVSIGDAEVGDGTNSFGGEDALKYLERLEGKKDSKGLGITSTSVTSLSVTRQAIDVYVASGTIGGSPDQTTFIYGDTAQTTIGGVYNESGTTVSSGQQAAARITSERGLHVNLRNSSGAELGTVSDPLNIEATSFPLPMGASTSDNQINGSQKTQVVNGSNTLLIGTSGNITVSGLTAVGSAPALNPLSISGIDGGGLKRHILTDTSGRIEINTIQSLPLPSGAATAVNQNPLDKYRIGDEDSLGLVKYYGFISSTAANKYYILKQDTTTTPYSYRYANLSNNPTRTDYGVSAWVNRATLTYNYLYVLTGL